ncbi:MAG: AMP-binding protein, partial [Candidatus Hydrogenedens sp.]
MLNLGYVLEETAKNYPDITAIILDQIKINFSKLNKYSNRVANILKQKGLKKGDKVALMIPNLPYFPIVYYGILKAGGVVVPVNVLYQKMEIEHYIRDSEAVTFFVYQGCSEEAIKAFQSVDSCKNLI